MGRSIGTAGELFIEQWCALSGITANRSEPDRHGWDLHFEMPPSVDITSASGLHEANVECKVQVKTTDTKKKTESIELSNLRSMVTSTLPAFYILIELAGGQQPQAAHLLHIDDEICSKVLERVRRETAKPGKPNLHKKTMSLDFKRGVKILPLNGEGLKAEILRSIGSSQADYVVRKQMFLKSCGFEEKGFSFSFQVDAGHADKFVGMLLGDTASLEVKGVKGSVTRFGISEQWGDMQSDTAVMSLSDVLPDGVARVVFRNRITGAALECVCDIYKGGAVACVPPKFRVVRLKSSRFSIDMSMHNDSLKMFFHASEDVACEVGELLRDYKLIKMLTNPSDISMSIEIDGKVLVARLGGRGFEGDFDKSLEMLEAASYVKDFYEYYGALDVIPNWFERNGPGLVKNVVFMKNVINLNKLTWGFTLVDGTTGLKEAECVVALPIILGERCFVSVLVCGGDLVSKGEGSYELIPSRVSIIYKTHFTVEYLVSGKAMDDLQEVLERYEGSGTVVSFMDVYMAPLVENVKRALAK